MPAPLGGLARPSEPYPHSIQEQRACRANFDAPSKCFRMWCDRHREREREWGWWRLVRFSLGGAETSQLPACLRCQTWGYQVVLILRDFPGLRELGAWEASLTARPPCDVNR